MKTLLCVLTILVSVGCSWVKPTVKSQGVALATEDDIVNCVKKGSTSVRTVNKILFIPRSRKKVFTELVTLAKNEAVILQGDTIVADGDEEDAAMMFLVYQCHQ